MPYTTRIWLINHCLMHLMSYHIIQTLILSRFTCNNVLSDKQNFPSYLAIGSLSHWLLDLSENFRDEPVLDANYATSSYPTPLWYWKVYRISEATFVQYCKNYLSNWESFIAAELDCFSGWLNECYERVPLRGLWWCLIPCYGEIHGQCFMNRKLWGLSVTSWIRNCFADACGWTAGCQDCNESLTTNPPSNPALAQDGDKDGGEWHDDLTGRRHPPLPDPNHRSPTTTRSPAEVCRHLLGSCRTRRCRYGRKKRYQWKNWGCGKGVSRRLWVICLDCARSPYRAPVTTMWLSTLRWHSFFRLCSLAPRAPEDLLTDPPSV